MKRNWNWSLWIGFVFVLVALFSYNFLRPVSGDPRFPVGESFVVWCRRNLARYRSRPRFWQTASLSRQNLRIDIRASELGGFQFVCLRSVLSGAPIDYFDVGAARRRKSAGVRIARPERQTSRARRSSLGQGRVADFLSRTLVTAL